MRSYLSVLIGSKATAKLLSEGPAEPYELARAPEIELINKIGRVRTRRIMAALSLGKACWIDEKERELVKIKGPKDIFDLLEPRFKGSFSESMIVVLLSHKNRVRRVVVVAKGGAHSCAVEPSDIFRPAVSLGVTALVVAHNHPSGDPEPSEEDKLITQRLVSSGNMLGVRVLDHVIIGNGRFISLKDNNPDLWDEDEI